MRNQKPLSRTGSAPSTSSEFKVGKDVTPGTDIILTLRVTPGILKQWKTGGPNQLQCRMDEDLVRELVENAQLPEGVLPNRKRGYVIDITIITDKGTHVTFRQEDTHAIWYGHQKDENAKKIMVWIAERLDENDEFLGQAQFPVHRVERVELFQREEASIQPPTSLGDMGDCPV